jgi:hypothetical protein
VTYRRDLQGALEYALQRAGAQIVPLAAIDRDDRRD